MSAAFWVICQFDKPNGSARNLGPSSIPSLSDGVMLDTAWIGRPSRHAVLHSRFHVPSVQHGSAAMLKPMIDIPLASLRCPQRLCPTTRNGDTAAALAP